MCVWGGVIERNGECNEFPRFRVPQTWQSMPRRAQRRHGSPGLAPEPRPPGEGASNYARERGRERERETGGSFTNDENTRRGRAAPKPRRPWGTRHALTVKGVALGLAAAAHGARALGPAPAANGPPARVLGLGGPLRLLPEELLLLLEELLLLLSAGPGPSAGRRGGRRGRERERNTR